SLPFEPKELRRAKAFLFEAGDVHRPAFAVETGWPSVFGPVSVNEKASRLALADWLTSDKHALAARVYVNRIWQHHFGRRLEAEAIRDAWLAASGELDRTIGGASTTDEKSRRRSLYLFQKREAPPQMQALFDGPFGMTESCGRRQTTTVALQPLYLLNSSF